MDGDALAQARGVSRFATVYPLVTTRALALVAELRKAIAKYVIVVEVPSMKEHQAHDEDPDFQEFDRLADRFQPEGPLVYGGDLIHAVG